MRVAMYYSNADVRLQEMPVPAIGRQEILMKVEASGICGSDVMEWYRRDKVPLVLGHEVAGTVAETGPGVKRFRRGDRIVATHHVPCGRCEFCRDGHPTVCDTLRTTHFEPGGFAEFIRLPAINVRLGTLKLPKGVSFADGSFVEPLGCVVRGQRLAGMRKGRRVLVIGSGLAGLLHIKVARYHKARTVISTDVDPFRLQKAKECGADLAIGAQEDVPGRVRDFCDGRLADLTILCSPVPSAIEQGLKSTQRGGTVLVFTAAAKDALLPVPINAIFWKSEVTLLSSYAASPRDLKDALALIAGKKIIVKDLITHRLSLPEIQKGFDLVCRPNRSLKVIIEPQR